MRRYLHLLRYLRPHRVALGRFGATMLAATVIGLLEPWPLKLFVDNVAGGKTDPGWLQSALHVLPGPDGPRGLLFWVVASTVALFVVGTLISMANSLISTTLSQRMTFSLGADVFAHLQRLSPLYHYRRPAGDTLARVTGDPSCVSILVLDALVPAVHATITIALMLAIMFSLQPTLTLLSLGVAPFLVVSMRIFGAPMKRRSRAQRDYEGELMSVIERTLSAIPVVQAFTREPIEQRRYVETADRADGAYRRAILMSMGFKLAIGAVTTLGTAGIMYLGGLYVLDGRMTVGTVIVFLSYLGAMYGPLHAFTYTNSTLQYAFAQADRVMEIMDTEPEVSDAPDARELTIAGRVRFEDVSFAYEPGRPVLQHVSLEADPGDVVAVVGPTGAGKTTLVNMLVRFFDPDSGRVTIDGVDLRQIRVRSLRRQVALVLQDPFVFPVSAADNIAYGRPDATREEVLAAARAANADGFISALADGYENVIGERGATLSGGEKQRLSIARAFLKDAPILVLDEPTSALDARTEAMLLEALERLMEGRVTFIIAHRLSTIRNADRIVVIDAGRIVEQGRHADLLAAGGLYAGLYRQQMDLAEHDEEPIEIRAEDVEQLAHGNGNGNGNGNGRRGGLAGLARTLRGRR
jgi:ATP-binding cassette subfamily B protein